jgi:hypothetical protein
MIPRTMWTTIQSGVVGCLSDDNQLASTNGSPSYQPFGTPSRSRVYGWS